ncbi:ubiquitin-protein ligase, putative [Ricinus communis]|uniref:RING-type E3 ubiquitin transferase n=1 Tax=Ricinus communis TaxID=3988 RepID=B9SG36_RICCO|nr:ubiquitin-protein ligase, putative [Ricinus communis]
MSVMGYNLAGDVTSANLFHKESSVMEISLLKALLSNISSFLHLSSIDNICSDLVQKCYQKAEEILKLLKPILDAIVDSEIASDEVLTKAFDELGQSVDELRELFENWQPLSSKVFFVLQIESLISKIRTLGLDIFQLLKSSHEHLPDELSTSSLEEILIEAVALEKLKENAEQAEKPREAELFDQMISLSQTCSHVPIPADFCCPLSLELMTDPVIVGSGQTYERAFIKNWIELGLTVCPKTRQTLAHTNLIPNYTVKALIANWCESNNVKLPDPVKSVSFNQPSALLIHAESGTPRGSHGFYSRGNQPMSPESTRSTDSPDRNWISSSVHRESTSPCHPRSTSDSSLSGIVGNEQGLDMARISLASSEERSVNLEGRNRDSGVRHSVSPSRNEVSNAVRVGEPIAQSHSRNASASSINASFSQGAQVDTNDSSEVLNHLTSYSSDNSGEVKAETQASTALNSPRPHREPEFAPRFIETRSRSQTIWRRPSDRLIPRIVSSPAIETRADLSGVETQVRNLVEDLKSDSIDVQRAATAELRLLAKHNMDNRIVIANCGAINILVNLLRSADAKIQENAVTALLNLSINDNNKTAIANADAIGPLIHVLETGSPEAKENSAATLFSLSVIEDNKVRIGRSGAVGPLVDLLGNGTPRGKKDAATALFNLSIFHENKARIVQAGAVKHLVELMDPAAGMVDKAVAVLANLATIPEGRTAIGQEGGIPVLVEVVELGSARGKENAAAALLQLCTNSNRFCNTVLQEGAVPPLVALSQSGTPRAKEKAQALLSFFRNQRHGNARG